MNMMFMMVGCILLIILILIVGFIIRYHTQWFRTNKKKLIAVIIATGILTGGGLFYPSLIITGRSVESTWYYGSGENSYYRVNTTVQFHNINIETHYVTFNQTQFIITCPNRVNITIMDIDDDIAGAIANEYIIEFYVNVSHTADTVTFQIGGLIPVKSYNVTKDNTVVNTTVADLGGHINFVCNTWTLVNHRFRISPGLGGGGTSTVDMTVRTYGIDYFTWLGENTTAYWVYKNMTAGGLNEGSEYISIFNNVGVWVPFYGDKTGTNWTIHTFNVVKSYIDDTVGNITFNARANPYISYIRARTVTLVKKTYGYNYTGYSNTTVNTLLSTLNTTLTLATGYSVARWNRTVFKFDVWISGFGTMTGGDYAVGHYDVIFTKINIDKTWTM